MSDLLAPLAPADLAAFYRRLADFTDKNKGPLKVSLAAMLMRHWLDNRNASSVFEFDAPDHIKNHSLITEGLIFNRKVFLTQKRDDLPASLINGLVLFLAYKARGHIQIQNGMASGHC